MFLASLTNRGATPALVQVLTYTQARHRMISENVANWQTPGFKTRQLDPRAFQKALREALDAKGANPHRTLALAGTDEFHLDDRGHLRVTPREQPVGNLLFHDGTNASIERFMADLAENAMVHDAATTLLRGNYAGLRKAIRGQL